MPPPAPKKKLKKIDVAEEIRKHANSKGVTILIDFDESTSMSQSGAFYSFEKDKILTINARGLVGSHKQLVLDLIREIHNDGELLWKSEKSEALSSYKDYSSSKRDKATLEFFKKLIPRDDYDALKMSMYIRHLADRKKPIHTFKMDIKERFGDRGVNICNLCSAGYFETEFKTLYDTDTTYEFRYYYDLVVNKKARALFVNSLMSLEDIENEVLNMVNKAIMYHIDGFRIHGIGKTNVERINEFASSRLGDEDYTVALVYDAPKFPQVEYYVKVKLED